MKALKVNDGTWSVRVIEDGDGHLNIYVTNSESEKLWDVEGDQNGDELHYRITTEELERDWELTNEQTRRR